MAKLDVLNVNNEVVGSAELAEEIISAEIKPALIHEVVVMQLACKRAGTHSTKTKGNVRGGGSKPWRQKGTGRARSGSSRSPLWRGGGTIFGPLPRDYSYTMPRKKVRSAMKSILSAKHAESRVFVIDSLDIKEGKTKEAAEILKRFEADRGVLFIVDDSVDEKAVRAFRNIPCVDFLHVNGLNVYDVVNARKIFILKSCLEVIEARLTQDQKTA